MKSESKRKILVAGMGISPAVLTNTVWALAHQKKPIVPDEIVVFITKNGKIPEQERVREQSLRTSSSGDAAPGVL